MPIFATGSDIENVNTYMKSQQLFSNIEALDDGKWIVTWETVGQFGNSSAVMQQLYSATGNKLGGEQEVGPHNSGYKEMSGLARLADNGWVVTWEVVGPQLDHTQLYMQRYDKNGTAVGGEVLVNPTKQDGYIAIAPSDVVGLDDKGWVVTWNALNGAAGADIFQQRYDKDGNAIGGEVLVNTTTADSQVMPDVTALTGGGWVNTWQGHSNVEDIDIFQQRFDKDGNAVGNEVRVNTTTEGYQWMNTTCALSSGGWVTAWKTSYVDKPGEVVYSMGLQMFKADGTPLGGEIGVAGTLASDFTYSSPDIVALPNGGFVLVWSAIIESDNSAIFQQRFDKNGHSFGDPEQVDQGEQLAAGDPHIAVLSDGSWVISWSGYEKGESFNVYQRHFAPDVRGTYDGETLNGTKWGEKIFGLGGKDTLIGNDHGDQLLGGYDNDIYHVKSGASIVEYKDQGTDTVFSIGSHTLEKNVEILHLETSGNALGNAEDNSLFGSNTANMLYGYDGNDKLIGNGGKDKLVGGLGIDKLYGGTDSDIFSFNATDTGNSKVTADTIYDFTLADDIDLKAIDADGKFSGNQAFSFIGTQGFHGKAGELRFDKLSSDTWIYGDTNGDKKADIVIHLDDAVSMAKGYFIL